MMATSAWQRIKAGVVGGSPAQDEDLRRVGLRLAAQTVALVLVMLLALEVIVYLITNQALRGSLETALSGRARLTTPNVCYSLHLSCAPQTFPRQGQPLGGQGGLPGGQVPPHGQRQGEPPFGGDVNPTQASSVFVNTDGHVYPGGSDALDEVVLDRAGVRQALHTGRTQCCSTRNFRGEDYLVYTKPLRVGGKIVGVIQTNISASQYEGALRVLVQVLVIVALLGLLTSGGISAIMVNRSLRPIRTAIRHQRDFVADAAHELRTPLAIMRTVGEVGLNDASPEDQQSTIEQMLAENQHLTRLVDDLSLLARADTHAVAINRAPVDLADLVSDTVAELGPLAEAQGAELECEVQGAVRVSGDVLRLRQLLLILLDNALKHTPAGGTVRVRLTAQGARARLEVTDTGPGISHADLQRIFDRFYRADRARTSEGSGLGLAIGRWIVEAHGGQIQAGNAPSGGAVFTVTLPLLRVATPV